MLFVGTTNPGKVAEVAALLAPLGVRLEIVSKDMPETKDSFEGNAEEKALAYAALTGGVTLSEDSGLCVTALEGLPGPWSARFADLDLATRVVTPSERPRDVIDAANSARVIELLRAVEQPRRAALMKVALTVARPGEVLFRGVAEYHGWIADAPRGARGFGYDPIFVGQDTFGRTLAELDPVRKNLRSHRRRVLDELFVWASQHRDLLGMIVVDGNDGTGKSTLVAALRALGYEAADRGVPTKATLDMSELRHASKDDAFVILDLPEATSRERLARAGKDMNEEWHTLESLVHFRVKFREIAAALGVPLIDATGTPADVLARVLEHLGAPREAPARPLRLGIPKGRLQDSVAQALSAAGCALEPVSPRNYHPRCPDPTLAPFVLKPRSIPQMIALGLLDLGFCGRDLVVESGHEERLVIAADLGTQRVRLVAAAADPRLLTHPPERPLFVATEFPLLASRWATGRGLAHVCLNTWGSTEAWVPEYADLCVDVVETGATLAQNGLTVLDELLVSSTCLVARADSPARHHRLAAALRRAASSPGPGAAGAKA